MLTLSRRLSWLLVLVLAAGAGACRQSPAQPPPVGTDIWAVVDGREIRAEDVEKAYRRSADPKAHLSTDEETAAKLNLLDQLITQNILVATAAELKIDLADADLDTAFNNQKKGIPEQAFNEELASRNLTATDVRAALRSSLIAQKVLDDEVTAKIAVTDRDINDYFEANRAQFNFPEDTYHLTQIVVTSVKDAGLNNRTGDDATTPQAAAAKVQMVMDRLKAGTPFNELAMDFSEEPASAPRGGDVGMVTASSLRQAPANLRDAVLKAQPGQVTVVAMEGGYTIVGLVAKFPGGQRNPSMPDVHDGITATVKGQREQLLRVAYLEGIRNRAKVVNYAAQRIVETLGKPSMSQGPQGPRRPSRPPRENEPVKCIKINSASHPMSTQPSAGGPIYWIRNIVYNAPGGSTRSSAGSPGVIFYHNTVTSETTVPTGSNTHWLNNLFLGENTQPAIFSVTTLTPYSSSDYNGFRPNPDAAYSFQWNVVDPGSVAAGAGDPDAAPAGGRGAAPARGAASAAGRGGAAAARGGAPAAPAALQPGQFKTLTDYALATGQDRHSVLVDYDVFVNVPKLDHDPKTEQRLYEFKNYDFRLKQGSAAIDKGVVIPNVNDGFTGSAPDLGALEAGQPLPTYGPRP